MFPPMSPLGERVRVELENQQLEREAAARGQLSQGESGLQRLRHLFSNLWRHTASPNAGGLKTLSEQQAAP